MGETFAALMRQYREEHGQSRHHLAQMIGCDASYLTRIENSDREPPRRHIIEGFSRALKLPLYDQNRLLAAAGYLPVSIQSWTPMLQAIVEIQNDLALTETERREFEYVVRLFARLWRASVYAPVGFGQ